MDNNNDLNSNNRFEQNNDLETNENLSSEDNRPLGLDENIAGVLCYLLGAFTGIFFLVLAKENRFVKFHSIQSILVTIVVYVISLFFRFIPFVGWVLSFLISPLFIVIWIILMVKAYKHEMYEFPLIGNVAQELAEKYK